jgi:hypothetical protein
MKTKARESGPASELQFELKYCERCGGLWLRPVGGRQVYCTGCGRAMAELPPASRKPDRARVAQRPRLGEDHDEIECRAEDSRLDQDNIGGVA